MTLWITLKIKNMDEDKWQVETGCKIEVWIEIMKMWICMMMVTISG